MRVGIIAALLLVGTLAAGCGGGTTPTTGAPSAPVATTPPAATTPPPTTTPAATTPPATATPRPTSTRVTQAEHGLEITLPAGWIVLTPEIAADTAAVAALKAAAGANAGFIDDLLGTLEQHPEYWLVAINPANQHVMNGTILTNTGDLETWSKNQGEALVEAYGEVGSGPAIGPRPGTFFGFYVGQLVTWMYGFERPDGIALFTFAAPRAAGTPTGWNEIVATFKDAGN